MKAGFLQAKQARVVDITDYDIPLEDRDKPYLLNYIAALEKDFAMMISECEKVFNDNVELSIKCKEHYDKVQELIRYELKVTSDEKRYTHGEIAGTNQKWEARDGEIYAVAHSHE